MTAWLQGGWYWLNDAKDGWLAVQFEAQDGDQVTLKSKEEEEYIIPASTVLRAALPSSLHPYANLLELAELHEGAILNTLRLRYANDDIYTYISSIVLSINPYKQLPCYGPSHISLYRNTHNSSNRKASTVTSSSSTTSEPLPPHVYALADEAYNSLIRDHTNQAILISGESGAGKTEATKLVLQYMAEVGGQDGMIAQQILEANPILESFGNAKTVRNNNSSRFGKWMEVHFEQEKGKIGGAKITSYLLEKSRVVNQSSGERNYHSFYQLCAGCTNEDERKLLHLPASGAGGFRMLTHGGCLTVDGQDDVADFADLRNAMSVLNFDDTDSRTILKILAAILHVGNVEFELDSSAGSSSHAEEKYRISNAATSLNFACELLSLDPAVCSRALVTKQLKIAGGEIITVFPNATACSDNRDSLAKTLYEALFNYLIRRINLTLGLHAPVNPKIIGVLDIFGFENFEETGNYFEQLMINYANEKLNEHFTEHIFRLESKTYLREGIDVSEIDFVDHAQCLALIEERRIGIIDMVAEEIRLPKGSDENLLQRMHDAYAPSASSTQKTLPMAAYYIKPKTREQVFGVRHYAGEVTYRIEQFTEKSKDALPEALSACIESSTEPVVARLLEKEAPQATPAKSTSIELTEPFSPISPPGPSTSPAPPLSPSPNALSPPPSSTLSNATSPLSSVARRYGSMSLSPTTPTSPSVPRPSARGSTTSATSASAMTLGAQFRSQLTDLLTTLNNCRANFLRCLKPNADKIADNFDSVFVLRQLQYLGIKEVISIRQQGFPVRMKYKEFLGRYNMILDDAKALAQSKSIMTSIPANGIFEGTQPVKDAVTLLLQSLPSIDAKDWRLGRTQVFFRQPVQTRLEARRDAKFINAVICVQTAWRGYQARKIYQLVKACSRTLARLVKETESVGPDATALLASLDATINDAVKYCLPTAMITNARTIHKRLHETGQARRALEAACGSKDVQLLQKAIKHAQSISLPPDTIELVAATVLVERLVKYQALLKSALDSREIPALEAALIEAASLGLDSEVERDATALLKRLQAEATINAKLDELLKARGPLDTLASVITQAETIGMVPSKGSPLTRAQALAALLVREKSLLETLSLAITSRVLAQLDAALHDLLADETMVAIHSHELVAQATSLKESLLSAALASERAANLEASFAGKNVSYIESSLAALRALGKDAITSLGEEGLALQFQAEDLIVQLKERARVIDILRKALEDHTEPVLVEALKAAKKARVTDVLEFGAIEKILSAFQVAKDALAAGEQSTNLSQLDAAIGEATKLGLTGPLVEAAHARRAHLLGLREVETLLTAALQSQEESMLANAVARAVQAGLSATDERLQSAQTSLAKIKADQAAELAEKEAAAKALADEQARLAQEAQEQAAAQAAALAAQAEAQAAAAAAAAATTTSPTAPTVTSVSSTSSTPATRSTRAFHAETYRASHFNLALFPYLRSVDEFSNGKIFGRSELKATMLSWSKDPLPKSLYKFAGANAEELNSEALNLFKTIQGFCGDRVYSFVDSLGCELLSKAVTTPQLRDEVFLQLAKQINGNSSIDSVKKAWQLFAMSEEVFHPSPELKPFLYNFLLTYSSIENYHAANYVTFCLRILQLDLPVKGQPPSIEYVQQFREKVMVSANVRVYMTDGSYVIFNIDATMSAEVCVRTILDQIGLKSSRKGFGIYHVAKSQSAEPSYITPNECLLDYPASKSVDDDAPFRFLFQKRIWRVTLNEEFPASVEAVAANAPGEALDFGNLLPPDQLHATILYFQLIQDIFLLDHYVMTRPELIQISAWHQRIMDTKLLAMIGEKNDSNYYLAMKSVQPNLLSTYSPAEVAAFRAEVGTLAASLTSPASYSPFLLLRSFATRPHLGFQAFTVENTEIKVFPPELWIGATFNGLFLIDSKTKEILKQFKLHHLGGWASNAAKFSVRVLIGKGKTQQLNFSCKQGKRIAATIQQLVDVIVAEKAAAALSTATSSS